ncbi:MAG: microcin ABC transporter permease, partial [Betaproteobacteria bacterium]|nr:microcin ABC transporter permease [Betaproteobacteria bacterium]
MAAYIFKRLLLMVPTLFGVLLMTFVVIQFVPGGPVEQMVSQLQGRDSGGEGAPVSGAGYRGRQGVDSERIAEIRALYGFDKPPVERFTQMLWQFAQFDLGKSFFYPKDVWTLVKEKLPVSISLGLWTFLLSYAISIPLGVAKAVRAGSRFDMVSSLVVLAG